MPPSKARGTLPQVRRQLSKGGQSDHNLCHSSRSLPRWRLNRRRLRWTVQRRIGGVRRLLLRRVLAELGRCGVRQLAILADPHAAGFYEAMGARFVRMAASDAIPGRELPLYVLGLKITA